MWESSEEIIFLFIYISVHLFVTVICAAILDLDIMLMKIACKNMKKTKDVIQYASKHR